MLCDNEDVGPGVIMSSDVMIYESCPPKLQARRHTQDALPTLPFPPG